MRKLERKWGHIKWYVAHQYSRVGFDSSVEVNEVNLSLYYGGAHYTVMVINLFYKLQIATCACYTDNIILGHWLNVFE